MAFGPDAFQKAAGVSRETLEKFRIYENLLKTWQKRINLVGPSTLEDVWQRHFWDSAQLLPHVIKTRPEGQARSWLDIGTGAGFPGLVLSLLDEHPVRVVEKNPKKCAFLRQVVRETGAGAEILQTAIEDLEPFPADMITARALAPVERIFAWGLPFLNTNGEYWLLKGKGVEQELTSLRKNRNMRVEIFQSLTDKGGKIVRLYNIEP